ncbi:hypothetical protein BD560DRAFT_445661 [Blakeslea trispora]|nr:hypothetical protein BD560DRAFT_445661 [Blakeslea trispora]
MRATDNFTATPNAASKVIWGFMLENTLFTEFEERNHAIIEAAYKQCKRKQGSHYIHIVDANLPKPGKAKVYFGVVQNHLRMPGTRYYVNRRVIKGKAAPTSPAFLPTPTSTSSTTTASSTSDTCLSQLDPQFMAMFLEDLSLLSPNYASSISANSSQLPPDSGMLLAGHFADTYSIEGESHPIANEASYPFPDYPYSLCNINMHFIGTGLFTDTHPSSKYSYDPTHCSNIKEDTVPWSSNIISDYFTYPFHNSTTLYNTIPNESFSFY